MLVYNYDKITNEFLSTTEANLDELETSIQGKEVYILPANATFKAPPPKQEGFTPCFFPQQNNWKLVEDNRGKTVYNRADLSTYTIVDLGPIPSLYYEEKPEPQNIYQVWQHGRYVYPDIQDLREKVKFDLDLAYNKKLKKLYKVGSYFIQPEWATTYTNTLVAMQQDVEKDGKLDNIYYILLISDAKSGAMQQISVTSINEFMPYYNKVKEVYKKLTEVYHKAIVDISTLDTPESIVAVILNY